MNQAILTALVIYVRHGTVASMKYMHEASYDIKTIMDCLEMFDRAVEEELRLFPH